MTGELIRAIFGRRELSLLPGEDYVDWAGEMLTAGADSYSLRILAGLEKSSSPFEIENYFVRSMDELGIEQPTRDDAIRGYACQLARKIIDGSLSGREGVRLLYRLCVAAEYPREFSIWYELDDALSSLEYNSYPHTYPSATLENFDSLAKIGARTFVATCGQ